MGSRGGQGRSGTDHLLSIYYKINQWTYEQSSESMIILTHKITLYKEDVIFLYCITVLCCYTVGGAASDGDYITSSNWLNQAGQQQHGLLMKSGAHSKSLMACEGNIV